MKGPLRDRSFGTKLTEVEYAQVEAAALRAGVGLSEWCRRVALHAAETDGGKANGGELTGEDMRELIERADRDKQKRAAALLGDGANEGA